MASSRRLLAPQGKQFGARSPEVSSNMALTDNVGSFVAFDQCESGNATNLKARDDYKKPR